MHRVYLPAAIAALVGVATAELPRRGVLGVQVALLGDAQRAQYDVEADVNGVLVVGVAPGLAAAQAGLASGDVIVSIDGVATRSVPSLQKVLSGRVAGAKLQFTIHRAGEALEREVALSAASRETHEAFDVSYGNVKGPAGRQRTIITKPSGDGPFPALLWIQGLSCSPVENVPLYQDLLYPLTESGFVTLRVEKPGIGDSEGGPCIDIDFETERAGYAAALAMLKDLPYVNSDRVFIFGHSMGGVFGPLIARENPVRGIIVYGAAMRTWPEYVLENSRRQAELSGASYGAMDQAARLQFQFAYEIYAAKKTPKQVAEISSDLAAYVAAVVTNDKYMYTRHYRFFQQLYDVSLGEVWESVDADVLALYGGSDFVTSPEDHRMIAAAVNRTHPGRGEYRVIEHMTHGLGRSESQATAISEPLIAALDPRLIDILRDWLREKCRSDASAFRAANLLDVM